MAQNELNLYVSNRGEDGQLMDWTKAATSLTSGIATAAGMRSLRRTENEQFKKSAEEEVAKDLNLRDNTLNDVLVFGTSAGRSKINNLYNDMQNGRISRAQYKASMANIKTNWNKTAEYIKNVDNMYAAALDDFESGKSSKIRVGIVDYFGRLNDLGNKALSFDDNGNISIAVFNNEQKPIAYQDINALNNLMNTQFDKVDLTGMADVATKNLAQNKNYNVTDIRIKKELFEAEKKRFQNTVLSNSRSIASVLVDHGGLGFYFGDADKEKALEQLRESRPGATEADLVLLKQDKSGYTTSEITPEQLKKAMDIVGNEFEARFGREVDYPPGYGSGGGSGSGSGDEDKQKKTDSLWRLTYDSFNSLTPDRNRDSMSTKLTAATGGDVIFSPNPIGNGYIAKKSNGEILVGEERPLVHPKDVWVMIGEVTGNNKMTPVRWEELYGNSGLREANINKKKRNTPKNASAGTFLNWATEGSTVDYSSFN
jgi:hypothetical protein